MAAFSCSSNNFEEKIDKDELLVFGYGCKLFRDDERAVQLDDGTYLIPWMGDNSLLIDSAGSFLPIDLMNVKRYDARGYLSNVQSYEPVVGEWDDYWKTLEPEERALEDLCEEERYLGINKDLSEEAIAEEEELKRINVATSGAYSEIGFTYDDNAAQESNKTDDNQDDDDKEEDKPFKCPKGLTLPVTIPRPQTMKEHAIIVKTAGFVAQQGPQMEIVIKTKQAQNTSFAFLSFEEPLNLYYRFLVEQIRSGAFVPRDEPDTDESDSDSDSEGGYLHPSLFASRSEKSFQVPQVFKQQSASHSAYSQLVKNLKPHLPPPPPLPVLPLPPEVPKPETEVSSEIGPKMFDGRAEVDAENGISTVANSGDSDSRTNTDGNKNSEVLQDGKLVQYPPPDLQPIIDKMAAYVAKNGDDFELIVKSKGDARFQFLNPGNEFYPYYRYKKQQLLPGSGSSPRPSFEVKGQQPTTTAENESPTAVVEHSVAPRPDLDSFESSVLGCSSDNNNSNSASNRDSLRTLNQDVTANVSVNVNELRSKASLKVQEVLEKLKSKREKQSKKSEDGSGGEEEMGERGDGDSDKGKGSGRLCFSLLDKKPKQEPKPSQVPLTVRLKLDDGSDDDEDADLPLSDDEVKHDPGESKQKQLERKKKLAMFLSLLKEKPKNSASLPSATPSESTTPIYNGSPPSREDCSPKTTDSLYASGDDIFIESPPHKNDNVSSSHRKKTSATKLDRLSEYAAKAEAGEISSPEAIDVDAEYEKARKRRYEEVSPLVEYERKKHKKHKHKSSHHKSSSGSSSHHRKSGRRSRSRDRY